MSDSEGSILCQSDDSDVDRPVLRPHRSSQHGSQQLAALQNLAGQPCRCAKQTCFSQFSHCLEAVQAERERFRALSHADQAFGGLNSKKLVRPWLILLSWVLLLIPSSKTFFPDWGGNPVVGKYVGICPDWETCPEYNVSYGRRSFP